LATAPGSFIGRHYHGHHAVADVYTFNFLAHLRDLAGKLVAHDKAGAGENALLIRMNVRAADTAGFHSDQNIRRSHLRDFYVFYPEIFGSIKYGCFHVFLL
jgi:hypothetical protein